MRCLPILLLLVLVGCTVPVENKSKDGNVHFMLGVSYLREGASTKALKEFLQAVESDPKNPDVHAGLAQAYQAKRAFALAEEHYLKALELRKDDPQIENNLGALYLDMQQWDKAIDAFRKAGNNLLFGNSEIAYTGMGVAYFNKGDYLDAIESYTKALQFDQRYPQAHFYLGEAYAALNQNEQAISAYREALHWVPGYVAARYRLAMAYMRQDKTAAAREEFLEVVRQSPDSEQGHLARDYLAILK